MPSSTRRESATGFEDGIGSCFLLPGLGTSCFVMSTASKIWLSVERYRLRSVTGWRGHAPATATPFRAFRSTVYIAASAARSAPGARTYKGVEADANYKSAFRNCMRNRGHNVID